MRVVLGACRTMGLDFDAAWGKAINTLPRDHPERKEELAILKWARPAYQAAYEDADWGVIARPARLDAADWSDWPDRMARPGRLAGDESPLSVGAGAGGTVPADPGPMLAFVAAAIGASDGDDPAGVRSIVDPPERAPTGRKTASAA